MKSAKLNGRTRDTEVPKQDAKGDRALRLHGTIARKIGLMIVSGHHQPGDVLRGEVAASAKWGVSRTAYREAVRILAAKGMLDSRPKLGTRITPRSKWHLLDPDVLEWTCTNKPDKSLLADLLELRDVVASAAAGLAARRRSVTDLRAMRQALTRMERHSRTTEHGRAAVLAFHEALVSATKNTYMSFLLGNLQGVAHANTPDASSHWRHPRLIPSRTKVYKAIAARHHEDALQAMAELLASAQIDTPRIKRR